jgi:hypothetical protein
MRLTGPSFVETSESWLYLGLILCWHDTPLNNNTLMAMCKEPFMDVCKLAGLDPRGVSLGRASALRLLEKFSIAVH